MMSVLEYIECNNEDLRRDFEEHIYDNLFSAFASALPLNPPEVNIGDKHMIIPDVWTDGTEILCRTEDIADAIANVLDVITGCPMSHVGFYDPFDDAQSGETDDHTGWWYVDFD